MNEEKKPVKQGAIGRFFSRLAGKLDKKLEEKSKNACGCCAPQSKDEPKGCCGR